MPRRIVAALLVTVLVGATAASAEARQSPTAVTVNDPAGVSTITSADVRHWTEIARASGSGGSSSRQLQAQVLQVLMSFAWIEGEARAQGIVITDAEAGAEFEKQKRASLPKEADYKRFLRSSGQTEQDVRERVRLDLLSNRIRERVAGPAGDAVTDADVDADVQANGPMREPELRDVRLVLTQTRAAAQRARSALERGVTWSRVLRRYANDRSAVKSGGLLRELARDYLDSPLGRAVFRARRGRLIGPIKTEYGYFVAKVVRIRPSVVIPRDENRKLVREQLVTEAEQRALDAFVKSFTATWKERTVCASAYVWHVDCGNWDGTPSGAED